jgi:DNA-binding transcriptional LysR family regulator
MLVAHVEAFAAVARSGSFSTAARRLGVAQSTVSRRVQALEAEVGRELLTRPAGEPPRLTPAGAAFLERASRIVDAAGRAEAACRL